jgi:hypothetical protein
MKNGVSGTFVISWTQTALDGQPSAPTHSMRAGAAWRWTGEAVRIDGPPGVLPLGPASGMTEIRRRAAGAVRKLVRAAQAGATRLDGLEEETPLAEEGFTVTDGWARWTVTVIPTGPRRKPLCMFIGDPPPRDTDLWVVDAALGPRGEDRSAPAKSVICFTPGTMIRTAHGPRPVEEICEGDLVQTMDNGCAPVLWTGRRRISGARLHAMPELLPVRLRPGALGDHVPDEGLLVSPDHRVLLTGPRAEAVFAASEVLVRACDLIDDRMVLVDRSVRQLTYVHLALERHEIVFANNVPTESFHPASVGLDALGAGDRSRLLDLVPELEHDLLAFGDYARRMLTPPEAAILRAA